MNPSSISSMGRKRLCVVPISRLKHKTLCNVVDMCIGDSLERERERESAHAHLKRRGVGMQNHYTLQSSWADENLNEGIQTLVDLSNV